MPVLPPTYLSPRTPDPSISTWEKKKKKKKKKRERHESHGSRDRAGAAKMTNDFSVTLTYRQRGTRPPIFVAGTFTEPPWTPQEMECAAGEDGELVFSKTCVLRPGEDVQYKFRVGTGDWWVLDESSPTGTFSQPRRAWSSFWNGVLMGF